MGRKQQNSPKRDHFGKRLIIAWKFARRSFMVKVIVFIVFVNLALAMFYAYMEDIEFHRALYWATDTLTNTGSGLVPPHSEFTWYLTTFLMWIGLGITLIFVEYVYIRMMKKMQGKQSVKFQNHIILIGWNPKVRHFLNNLPGALGGHHNYVVVADLEEKPFDLPQIVTFILGTPIEDRILMAANVKKAQQVLVVVEDDADALLITMSIQSINPEVKISVNLHNRENIKHLTRIGVTEIVCDEELTGNALITAFYNNQKN